MRFTLYTEKTVSQCMSAVNERLHLKGTATRPGMDGWVDKSGSFSMGMSSPVIGKLNRTTYLRAKAVRESGVTVIRGDVSGGASPRGQWLVFAALALVGVVLMSRGSALLGLVIIPFAALLYIPMKGDFENSEVLLNEVQKILKAKGTPPKVSKTAPRAASTSAGAAPKVARPAMVSIMADDLEDEEEDDA